MMLLTEVHKDVVINNYEKENSIRNIAKELNISVTPIKKILRDNNINSKRNRWFYYPKKFDKSKEWLYQKYIVEKKTSYEIGSELKLSQPLIHFWIKKYGLKRKRIIKDLTREKIRQTLKSKFEGGELVAYFTGKKMPQHIIEACRTANKLKKGDKHWNWKGGITKERVKLWFSEEYKLWRKQVFERDNYVCQDCGNKGRLNLEAHHKKRWIHYPELRFEVDNGLTLCKECHNKTKGWLKLSS